MAFQSSLIHAFGCEHEEVSIEATWEGSKLDSRE